MRALKYHGGADLKELNKENLLALEKGIANLERHVHNVTVNYGLPCVVSINHFTFDMQAEIDRPCLIAEIIIIQPLGSKAKAYQVKQVRNLIACASSDSLRAAVDV